jgi:hypothetical protein
MCAANRLPQEEESLSVVELVQLAALVLDLRAQTRGPDKVPTDDTIPINQPQAFDPALGRSGFLEGELRVRFDLHARSSPLRLERRPGD